MGKSNSFLRFKSLSNGQRPPHRCGNIASRGSPCGPHRSIYRSDAGKTAKRDTIVRRVMIVFQGVSKNYTGHGTALEDIDFQIDPGEFVSLAGRSGAGKSTVIKLLIGEEKPSKGRVFFGQYEVNKLED